MKLQELLFEHHDILNVTSSFFSEKELLLDFPPLSRIFRQKMQDLLHMLLEEKLQRENPEFFPSLITAIPDYHLFSRGYQYKILCDTLKNTIKYQDCLPSLIAAIDRFSDLSPEAQHLTLCATIAYNDKLALPRLTNLEKKKENPSVFYEFGIDLNELALTAITPKMIARFQTINQIRPVDKIALAQNELSVLPKTIFYNFTSLRFVFLACNRLQSLPTGIFQSSTALERLFIHDNQLSSLPPDIGHLQNLKELFLIGNPFPSLSEAQRQSLNKASLKHDMETIRDMLPAISATSATTTRTTSLEASSSSTETSTDADMDENNFSRIESVSQENDGLSATVISPEITSQDFVTAANIAVVPPRHAVTTPANNPIAHLRAPFSGQRSEINSHLTVDTSSHMFLLAFKLSQSKASAAALKKAEQELALQSSQRPTFRPPRWEGE